MNVLWFVLLVSAGIIFLAVGIDVGQQIWLDRKARWTKMLEAEALLYAAIAKRFEGRFNPSSDTIELKVVSEPKKSVGGRHRLTAA